MLKQIEGKYGSKSGVIKQLSVLMQENSQMRKLASFNKYTSDGKQNVKGVVKEEKDFIEENKMNALKTKEEREAEKVYKT